MAILANRSPSPTPTSRPNSNPRNSEANLHMRRSFSGNPFQRPSIHTNPRSFVPTTPANSPADFSSRNCLDKEEKENNDHQTLKPAKARSPSVPKGSNHFMIPTISAASKINPSPRKKVLAERNEPLRTSLSFSDIKSPFGSINVPDNLEDFDRKSDKGFNSKDSETEDSQHNYEAVQETPSNPKPMFSSTKPFVSSISPSIAPLDADPSLQPYDPKTNYLSPRPQFLHYRPNPRLELYFQEEQGSGTKNLEDDFLSESLSDTEVCEESDPENSQKESDNASPVEVTLENPQKESENVSSVEAVSEEAELEFSEPEPITTHVSKETSEEKKAAKSRFFIRAKIIPMLLVLLIACLSASFINSPIVDSPVYESLSSSKFYEESFNGFARTLELWSVKSTCYVNELIRSLNGVDKLGPLQFSNLTYAREDPFNDAERFEEIYEQDDEVEPEFEDEDEFECLLDQDSEKGDQNLKNGLDFESKIVQPFASGLQNGIDFEKKSRLEAPEFSPEEAASQIVKGDDLIFYSKIEPSTVVSIFKNTFEAEYSTSVLEIQSSEQGEAKTVVIGGDDNLVSDSEIESTTPVQNFGNTLGTGTSQVDPEYNSKAPENGEIKGDGPLKSDSEIEPTKVETDSESTLEIDAYTSDLTPEYKSSEQYKTLVISLLALALIAAPVLIYLKKKTANTLNSAALDDPISTNKTIKSNPSLQSFSPELDLVGESCPSEMSSFDKSYSNSKRGTWRTTEARSQERKQKRALKRESLASSSDFSISDSPSYGSFTTYERLPSKHGYGDDEVVTPVRRSGRINKIQVTST